MSAGVSGCYICRPDDPTAAEDGCEECFASFIGWYSSLYNPEPPGPTPAPGPAHTSGHRIFKPLSRELSEGLEEFELGEAILHCQICEALDPDLPWEEVRRLHKQGHP